MGTIAHFNVDHGVAFIFHKKQQSCARMIPSCDATHSTFYQTMYTEKPLHSPARHTTQEFQLQDIDTEISIAFFMITWSASLSSTTGTMAGKESKLYLILLRE